jgi:hypothetical protein
MGGVQEPGEAEAETNWMLSSTRANRIAVICAILYADQWDDCWKKYHEIWAHPVPRFCPEVDFLAFSKLSATMRRMDPFNP